ncbi:MAG: glycosyltransferase family 39 protein, partial [Bdellovibrionia bacterium]
TRDWRWGLAIGAALGLGFTSKYHMVLFVPVAVVWLTWTWQWPKIPLLAVGAALVTGLLGSLPVLIWNYRNDFDSFRYQISHGLGRTIYNPVWALEFVGTHIGLLFPLTLWAIWRAKRESRFNWLYYFGFGPLFFFFISSFKGRPEANWPSVAYPALLGLALAVSPTIKWAKATLTVWSALFVLVCMQIIYPWVPVAPGKLKTTELTEYDVLAPYVESHAPLYASSFQMASTLSYKLKKPVFKLQGVGRKDFFDYLEESRPTAEHFYVAFREWDKLPEWASGYTVVTRTQINPVFHLLELRKN